MSEPVLCFVDPDRPTAFFTTAPLAEQTGDDWDDAPYEYNAGEPYPWRRGQHDAPHHELVELLFDAPALFGPADTAPGRSFSVDQINAGAVPWLASRSWDGRQIAIPAGTPISEFKRLVRLSGGRIFVEEAP